jgi:hypothetical protein
MFSSDEQFVHRAQSAIPALSQQEVAQQIDFMASRSGMRITLISNGAF